MVEKAGDVEAKANLQLPSYVWEIDSRFPKSYCPSSKKDKKDIQQEYYDEASKEKAKSQTFSTTNQPQIQNSKKRHGGRKRNCLAIGVNATKVVKKEKDKAKDPRHIKCYTCKQKGHYANKYPDKPKN